MTRPGLLALRGPVALIGESLNASGELAWSLRAEPGFGPARVAGHAVSAVPETVAAAAPLFQGVVENGGWTHVDTP